MSIVGHALSAAVSVCVCVCVCGVSFADIYGACVNDCVCVCVCEAYLQAYLPKLTIGTPKYALLSLGYCQRALLIECGVGIRDQFCDLCFIKVHADCLQRFGAGRRRGGQRRQRRQLLGKK